MKKELYKYGFIAIVFLLFLSPKIYFIIKLSGGDTNNNEIEKLSGDSAHYFKIAKNSFKIGIALK